MQGDLLHEDDEDAERYAYHASDAVGDENTYDGEDNTGMTGDKASDQFNSDSGDDVHNSQRSCSSNRRPDPHGKCACMIRAPLYSFLFACTGCCCTRS